MRGGEREEEGGAGGVPQCVEWEVFDSLAAPAVAAGSMRICTKPERQSWSERLNIVFPLFAAWIHPLLLTPSHNYT